MNHNELIGMHVSELLLRLGLPPAVPEKPPEGDPEYGLDRYVVCRDLGLNAMIDEKDVCCCVQLHGCGKEPSYHEYAGGLPGGVRFASSRSEVRRLMGTPARVSDGGPTTSIRHRPWDFFIRDKVNVHFEYDDPCDRILLVSLTPTAEKD